MGDLSRRNLLKAGLSSVGAGFVGISGCLTRANDGQGDVAVSLPEPSPPSYRRWLPEPASVGPADHDHYRARYYSIAELRDYPERKLSTFHRNRIRDEIDFFGVGDSVDELVSMSGVGSMRAHVVLGSYDGEEVREAVQEAGFSDGGTHGEYALLRKDDPARAVAIGDEAVLYGKQSDAIGLVEAIVDAAEGTRPRYHEVDGTFASLTEAVGKSAITKVETTEPAPHANPEILQFEGSVGRATARSLADGTEYVRHAIEFTEQADDRVETIRETVGDDESVSAVDAFADGTTVFVEAELVPET